MTKKSEKEIKLTKEGKYQCPYDKIEYDTKDEAQKCIMRHKGADVTERMHF